MTCPLEIAEVILELIDYGIQESRRAARIGDEETCARAADHLRNLTQLLHDYSDEQLEFYWEIERATYGRYLDKRELIGWQLLWERLRPYVEDRSDPIAALYAQYELGTVD